MSLPAAALQETVESLTSSEVARQIAAGVDAAAAEAELCRRFWRRARLYGLKHLRDVTKAEDLAQQVMEIVLRALRDRREIDLDRIEHYMLGVCRNTALAMLRHDRRDSALHGRLEGQPSPAPFEPPWTGLALERLEQCCGQLPQDQQAAVLMSFVHWRTSAEIAAALGTTAGNVRVLRHRALETLRECMEGAR